MVTQILTPNERTTADTTTTRRWQIDPSHSSAEFAVRHMMVSTVKGSFKVLSGTLTVDDLNPENSQVEAEIEAASIDTGVADRDAHLRSPDFFDVVRYPKLTFRSSGINVDGADSGTMHGDVMIHGVARPLTFAVSYLGEIRDPWGNFRRGYSAEATLNRKDFGMTWNQVLDAGGVLVGDKVKVTLNIEAIEKAKA